MNRAVSFSISLIGHVGCVALLLLHCKPAEEKPVIIEPCHVTLFAPAHAAPSPPSPTPSLDKEATPPRQVKQPTPAPRPKIVTRTITRRKEQPRVEQFEELPTLTKVDKETTPVPRSSTTESPERSGLSVLPGGSFSYDALIAGIVKSNWVRPSRAVVGQNPPSVSVSIRITLDGRITEQRITRSSGIRLLDDSAVKAIDRSNPLPVGIPSYMGCRYYDVTIVFQIEDKA